MRTRNYLLTIAYSAIFIVLFDSAAHAGGVTKLIGSYGGTGGSNAKKSSSGGFSGGGGGAGNRSQSGDENGGEGANNPARYFRIFDSTLYRNKPDLRSVGVSTAWMAYEFSYYHNGRGSVDECENLMPERSRIVETANYFRRVFQPGDIAVGDIEDCLKMWEDNNLSRVTAEQNMNYMISVSRQTQEVLGDSIAFGFYSRVPKRDYWNAIYGENYPGYRTWQQLNNQFLPLAGAVDFLVPSIYAFYTNQQQWAIYARENLKEARRLAGPNRPIYAALMLTYHYNGGADISPPAIPSDYWRVMLDTVYEAYEEGLADGIIIWGGWDVDNNRAETWDNNAPWWQVTQTFMAEKGLNVPVGTLN
jgi:hypothetical protein